MKRFLLKASLVLLVALGLIAAHPIEELGVAGIGLQVVPTEQGEVVVLAVLKGSPAMEAGLLPGDLILQIDGVRLVGTDFMLVSNNLIRGDGGSKVMLTYQRPGVSGTYSVTLVRRILMVPPVKIPGVKMMPSASEKSQ